MITASKSPFSKGNLNIGMTPEVLSSQVCENFDAIVRWHSYVFRLLMNENAVTYIFVNR